MRFENGSLKFEVDFQHRKQKVMVPPNAVPEKQKEVEAQITTCAIRVEGTNSGELNVSAQSICRPPDQFSKPLGRKLALTRALKISGLSDESKKLIWETYLKSLDVKRRMVVGSTPATEGLTFIQTPKKQFASAIREWQANDAYNRKAVANATSQRPSVPCPLPMEHPYFVAPLKYGFLLTKSI